MWAGLIEADASTAGFWPGDEVTVRELLYGVLLPSGADAVNALAFTISGSVDAFVAEITPSATAFGDFMQQAVLDEVAKVLGE